MNSPFALPAETVFAFTVFALVAALTPGPNNAMVMASGANFGFRRTVPHILGVVFGFEVLLLAVAVGLGGVFAAFPVLQDVLFVVGAAYLLWLAWKIANAGSIGGATVAKPFSFTQAVAFQWVNPKAWTGAIGAIAAYAPKDNYLFGMAVIAVIFLLATALAMVTWTGGGVGVRRFLERPGALRAFNIVMALALVLSLVPLAVERLMPPIRLF